MNLHNLFTEERLIVMDYINYKYIVMYVFIFNLCLFNDSFNWQKYVAST
jgi:hypothetical protein